MLPGTICSGFIQKVAGTVENIGISDAGFDLCRAVWLMLPLKYSRSLLPWFREP